MSFDPITALSEALHDDTLDLFCETSIVLLPNIDLEIRLHDLISTAVRSAYTAGVQDGLLHLSDPT